MTDKDRDVLVYIKNYISGHKYPPTYEEIRIACGIKSKSSVYDRVQNLLKEGFLETDNKRCPRAYRVTQKEY